MSTSPSTSLSNNDKTGVIYLPFKPFFSLFLALLTNGFNVSMLFPFAYFMVRDFHIASSEKEIGYYAGTLASGLFMGRFFSSFMLGKLSDTYGRKIILNIGLISTIIFSILFGFSTNYYLAVLYRFLGGLTNGIIAVTKVMASELVEQNQQGSAMAIVGAVWGAGMVLGSGLSGLLSQPCEKYPDIFTSESIFYSFPYLLPCLICSFLSIIALIAQHFLLPETLKTFQEPITHDFIEIKNDEGPKFTITNDDEFDDIELMDIKNESEMHSYDKLSNPSENISSQSSTSTFSESTIKISENNQLLNNIEIELSDSHLNQPNYSLSQYSPTKLYEQILLWFQNIDIHSENYLMTMTISIYSFWSLLSIMQDECFPLWAISQPEDGGLAFDSSGIGWVLSVTGLLILVFQVFIFPMLESKLGPLLLFRLAAGICCPVYLFFPYLTYITGPVMGYLIVANIIRSLLSLCVFTSSMLLINNSVPSTKRGYVNGAAMSIGSLFKAIGPACAGAIYSWSISSNLGFPFDFRFVFELVSLMSLLCCLMTFIFPSSIDRPPIDNNNENNIK